MTGLRFPGQTKAPEFAWAECGTGNTDRIFMRLRFRILRGTNSNSRRLGRRSAEEAGIEVEMEHVEL